LVGSCIVAVASSIATAPIVMSRSPRSAAMRVAIGSEARPARKVVISMRRPPTFIASVPRS
jgi:hypothetical protein